MTFVFDWNLQKTHGMLITWSILLVNEWWHFSLRGLSYNAAGCNYHNNESSDSIRVQVRHYQDSYIAAEEATKGCSSENINEKNCISTSISTENTSMSIKSSSYPYETVEPSSMYETIALISDCLFIFYFYIWNNIFD